MDDSQPTDDRRNPPGLFGRPLSRNRMSGRWAEPDVTRAMLGLVTFIVSLGDPRALRKVRARGRRFSEISYENRSYI
jgi:hypothetical protein